MNRVRCPLPRIPPHPPRQSAHATLRQQMCTMCIPSPQIVCIGSLSGRAGNARAKQQQLGGDGAGKKWGKEKPSDASCLLWPPSPDPHRHHLLWGGGGARILQWVSVGNTRHMHQTPPPDRPEPRHAKPDRPAPSPPTRKPVCLCVVKLQRQLWRPTTGLIKKVTRGLVVGGRPDVTAGRCCGREDKRRARLFGLRGTADGPKKEHSWRLYAWQQLSGSGDVLPLCLMTKKKSTYSHFRD